MPVDDLRFCHSSGKQVGGGRIETQAFLDAGYEVWELV